MEPAVPRHGKQPHRVQHQEEGAESARGKQRPRALKPGVGPRAAGLQTWDAQPRGLGRRRQEARSTVGRADLPLLTEGKSRC